MVVAVVVVGLLVGGRGGRGGVGGMLDEGRCEQAGRSGPAVRVSVYRGGSKYCAYTQSYTSQGTKMELVRPRAGPKGGSRRRRPSTAISAGIRKRGSSSSGGRRGGGGGST